MGGGDGVTGNGAPFPAAHLFPLLHTVVPTIPQLTIGGGGIPTDDQCVMHDGVTAGSFCTSPMSDASPARGQSSVGQRNPAASMSRQGPKLGRERRWRGFPGAPSGAGRGVSPCVPRIGTELGAWSRLRPADGVRGRGRRGDMFGRGSYTLVRRCKSSIFFRCNPECGRGVFCRRNQIESQ